MNEPTTADSPPVRIGLVGAGYWAQTMHAPLHAGPGPTELTGIWSPTPGRARALAEHHGVRTFESFDALLCASEAVDFAVPPSVQARLAVEAAEAGRGVLLEKPLGATVEEAQNLADAVDRAGVANLVVFTKRYHVETRKFIAASHRLAAASPIIAVSGRYVHGGLLQNGFLAADEREGWRDSLGILFDLGPHLLDLADVAAGSIQSVEAFGTASEAVLLATEHEGGASGQFLLSGRVRTAGVLTDLDVYAHSGHLHYTTSGMDHDPIWPVIRAEFAARVRLGTPVTVDVSRALTVQRVVNAAARSLQTRSAVLVPEIGTR